MAEGSDVELICHSSPDEGPIVWSYNGMPVDPQSASFDVMSEEITSNGGDTVVVTKLILREVSASRGITYMCKPQDDILNMDADEIEVVVTSTSGSKLERTSAIKDDLVLLITKTGNSVCEKLDAPPNQAY